MLLVYPFVRHTSRFNLPRHTECSPSFQFTAPLLPTRCRSSGTPTPHNGRCNTTPPPAAGHITAGRQPRCGRPLQSPPSSDRPFPLPPPTKPTRSPVAPHAAPRDKSTSHHKTPPPPAAPPRLPSAAPPVPAVSLKHTAPLFAPPQYGGRAVPQHSSNGARAAPFNIHHTSQWLGPSPPAPDDDRPRRVCNGGGSRHSGKPAGRWQIDPCASSWNRSPGSGRHDGKRGFVPS